MTESKSDTKTEVKTEVKQEVKVEAPKVKKKRGRKRKNKRYFTDITQIAIIAYNNLDPETERRKRNKIYNRFIHYPIDKMAENLIHTFKFYYIDMPYEDVKNSVVAHINEKLHMFSSDKGKAFSYFNRVAKNWLIQENQKAYDKICTKTDLQKWDDTRSVLNEMSDEETLSDKKEFLTLFAEYMDENLGTYFTNRRDIAIADSFLEIIKNRNLIENYNKKALYILIRERCRLKEKETQYITKVVNVLKKEYFERFEHYRINGVIINDSQKFF